MTTVKKLPAILIIFLATFTVGFSVEAVSGKPQVDPKLREAITFRADMAEAVASAKETPLAALARLKQSAEIKGQYAYEEADFALAALDIGHRLLGQDKAAEAEAFFRTADAEISQLLDRKDAQLSGKERAQFLKTRAHLRGNFLGRSIQARDDIDAAIALSPDDESLRETRVRLASGHGESFKAATSKQ